MMVYLRLFGIFMLVFMGWVIFSFVWGVFVYGGYGGMEMIEVDKFFLED